MSHAVAQSQSERPMRSILLGSTFPLSLIRRRVVIEPQPIESLKGLLRTGAVASFWGHQSTLGSAQAILGADLSPRTERPALRLTPDNLPELDGQVFSECWVLSPEYVPGFRPAIGEEVPAEKIRSWQVLRVKWEE